MEEQLPIEQTPLKGVSLRTFYTVITSTVIIMLYINNMGNKIDKLTDKVGYSNEMMDIKIRAVEQRQVAVEQKQDLLEIDINKIKAERLEK